MQTISLKLPDDLLKQLEKASKVRRMTKSALVRKSLEKFLEEPSGADGPSCYDLAKDLIGSIKGLPRDIATNPKYMKDFGK